MSNRRSAFRYSTQPMMSPAPDTPAVPNAPKTARPAPAPAPAPHTRAVRVDGDDEADGGLNLSLEIVRGVLRPKLVVGPPCNSAYLRVRRVVTDSRMVQRGDLFLAIVGDRFDGHHFVKQAFNRGAVAAVVSRADDVATSAKGPVFVVEDTVKAYGDIANWHRRTCKARVIGITGTNGKTTTKDLIAHLLGSVGRVVKTQGNQNNLIGVPLTLLNLTDTHDFAVVEMGTNAPGEIPRLASIVEPDCAVLTNAGPGHLEGLGDLNGVVQEKSAILGAVRAGGVAVVNFDDIGAVRASRRIKPRTRLVSYGFDMRCEFRGTGMCVNRDGMSFQLAGLPTQVNQTLFRTIWRTAEKAAPTFFVPMPGQHNVTNALAAIAVAWWAGLSFREISEALRTFVPPALRLTRRELCSGRLVLIDDCYNANPASMESALATLAQMPASRRIAVLGDMGELGAMSEAFHRQLGMALIRHRIDVLVTVGPQTRTTAEAVKRSPILCYCCDDAVEASEVVASLAAVGDTILVKGSRCMGLEVVGAFLQSHEDEISRRLAPVFAAPPPLPRRLA